MQMWKKAFKQDVNLYYSLFAFREKETLSARTV